jgi:Tfp pilus assembly protein PilV
MVEVVIAMFIVSVTVVSALSLVPTIQRGSVELGDRGVATCLAAQLTAEIATTPFESSTPQEVADALGRAGFDDVDHFHNWSSTPPEMPDGSPIAGAEGLTRRVTVVMVDPETLDPVPANASETGVRIVTVYIERAGAEVARHVSIRSRAGWEAR